MPFVRSGDSNIYYEVQGKGPPLILIAGYTCDHLYWPEQLLEPLRKDFTIITYDNRAIGQTTDQGDALSTKLLAEDLLGLVTSLNIPKPHILGHSLGGAIARYYAGHFPNHLDKLIILNSSLRLRGSILLAFKSLLDMRKKDIDFDLIFQAALPWIYDDPFLKDNQRVLALKKLILDNPHPQSIEDQERQFQCLSRFNGQPRATPPPPPSPIHAQTLIVYGKKDLVCLPYEATSIAHNIPQASLVGLDCAHGSPLELPEDIADLVFHFLSK